MAETLRPKIEADLGPLSDEYSNDYIARVISTLKERIKNIYDVPTLCGYFFKAPTYTSDESVAYRKKIGDETLRAVLPLALERFKADESTELNNEDAKRILKDIADNLGLKLPVVMNALRYTVSGVKVKKTRTSQLVAIYPSLHVLPRCQSDLTLFPHTPAPIDIGRSSSSRDSGYSWSSLCGESDRVCPCKHQCIKQTRHSKGCVVQAKYSSPCSRTLDFMIPLSCF